MGTGILFSLNRKRLHIFCDWHIVCSIGFQGTGQAFFQEQIMATGNHKVTPSTGNADRENSGNLASSVAQGAGQAASFMGHQAENAAGMLGSGMQSLAGTIRERGPKGMLGTATSTLADSLERGGQYLQEKGLNAVSDDMVNAIRRNPIPAVLVGVGLGFLLARFTN